MSSFKMGLRLFLTILLRILVGIRVLVLYLGGVFETFASCLYINFYEWGRKLITNFWSLENDSKLCVWDLTTGFLVKTQKQCLGLQNEFNKFQLMLEINGIDRNPMCNKRNEIINQLYATAGRIFVFIPLVFLNCFFIAFIF